MLLAKQFLIKSPLASRTFMFYHHPGSKVKIIKIDLNFPNDMRHWSSRPRPGLKIRARMSVGG